MTPPDVAEGLAAMDVLALTIDAEARNQSAMGMLAVGCCIRNRAALNRPEWGSTMRAVCLAKSQFSCWNPGDDLNHLRLLGMARRIRAGERPPELDDAYEVARAVYSDTDDVTNGADHYYAPKGMKPPGRVPRWAVGRTPCAHIGDHIFYALYRKRLAE